LDRLLRQVTNVRAHLPDLHVWLVGDGLLRSQLKRQVLSLSLSHFIHFLAVRKDVASYMNAADLLLLTSDTEGIAGVVLEAGLMGLPVVATRVGGITECVLEGKTAILVDPENEDGIAQAALTLLTNELSRLEMGERAKVWIFENFNMEKISQRYIDFLEKVLAS
jgi:glycosyltransferase involved in cell wall biosynthesis